MKKSLFLAASFLAVSALAGCSLDSTDDSGSSSNDIVTGDPRQDTGATYGTQPKDEAPLPALAGDGAESTLSTKKIIKLPATTNVKLDLEFPKPPVEGPQGEDSK